jgi:hypothetical protein
MVEVGRAVTDNVEHEPYIRSCDQPRGLVVRTSEVPGSIPCSAVGIFPIATMVWVACRI